MRVSGTRSAMLAAATVIGAIDQNPANALLAHLGERDLLRAVGHADIIPPIAPGVKPLHLGSPHRAVLWDRYGAVWLCGNASPFSRADPSHPYSSGSGYSHPTAICRGRGLPF